MTVVYIWVLGSVGYEMLTGEFPFFEQDYLGAGLDVGSDYSRK